MMDGVNVIVGVESVSVVILGVSCFDNPANPGNEMRVSNKNAIPMLMKKPNDEDLLFFMDVF